MVARWSLCTALIALSAASARADKADKKDKFVHKPGVAPNVTLTERTKPIPRRDDAPPAPPKLPGDEALKLEEKITDVHARQLVMLQKLIKDTPDHAGNDRANLSFQLGELYAKIYRFHRLAAVDADIKGQKAAGDEHRARAKDALKGTVETLKTMTDTAAFASYPRMDVALFYYAYTLHSAGYVAPAREAYDKLLKNYPASKYVAEAHFAFAEGHFEASEWPLAEARYRQVLKFPASSLYWHAQYKLAWVALNLKKPEAALDMFFQVANATRAAPDKQVLHRAAKKDFVRAYAEVGRADMALPAFQRVDAAGAHDMLGLLADLYMEQGKSARAITVLRLLMTQKPASPSVCAWQHTIARAMLTVKEASTSERITEIEQLVRLYGALAAKKALPRAEATECHDAAAEMSGLLARAYHQEAVKTRNPEHTAYANRLYKAYLGAFQDAPDYGEVAYFHAELAWVTAEMQKVSRLAVQQWEDAARAFDFALDTKKLDAARVKVAADAAMLAFMKARDVDPRVKPVAIPEAAYVKVPVPQALPELDQKLLGAYDRYLANVTDPDDSERIDVMFHKATLLRRYDHHDRAIPIFQEIVAKHVEHEAAEPSAQLALDSLNQLQRHEDMLAYARALPKKLLEKQERLAGVVKQLQRTGTRKEAERLEAEAKKTNDLKKFVGCALKYYEIYNADPLAKDGDELLFNAGVCFEQGRSLSAAKEAYELLQKYFPRSTHTAKAIARLGNAYGSIAYYKEAAERLEEFAAKYGGEDNAYLALSDAVQFRKGIGDDAEAIKDGQLFLRMFGDKQPARAANVHFSLIEIYEKRGELEPLVRHLREYIARYGKTGGPERLVTAQTKLGMALWHASCPVKAVDGSCMKVTRVPAIVAARRAASESEGVPRRCGEDTKSELTMVPRDARKVSDALAALGAAIATYDAHRGAMTAAPRGALYHYALARFTRTEHEYEQYLASPIPTGLDFDRRKPDLAKKSLARFDGWVTRKLEGGTSLGQKYRDLIDLRDADVGIAAASRIGSTLQNFSTQLFRAEVPADVRTGPFAEEGAQNYCDALEERARPIEAASLSAYKSCLDTSTRLGWFSDWSRICERELGQIDPVNFPRTPELRDAPNNAAAITDLAGPL
ncbi:MAG: tetratricopeptide repeat protein [Deltaproteobacteria bacterium]|nr:tetratricopeptide repeat protein [Deltaproteobacteria bacterium]